MSELSDEERWDLAQIRQRPSRLNAKPIGSVVRRLMAQAGYGQIEAANQLEEAWANAAGETLAKLTRPGTISRGVLLVHAANSATIQEMYFQKKQIIAKLQKSLPETKLKDIKARVAATNR